MDECNHKCHDVRQSSTPNKANPHVCLSQVTGIKSVASRLESESEEQVDNSDDIVEVSEKSGFVSIYKWTIRYKGRRG